MGNIFGKVSEISADRENPDHMNKIGSELYGYINATKVAKNGEIAIVEFTAIQILNEGNRVGDYLMHMQSEGYKGQTYQMMQKYVAAYNSVDVNHKFSEDTEENDAIWDSKAVEIFGSPVIEEGKMVYKNDNVMKGAVGHWKVVADNQSGRKNKKLDNEGNVIVFPKLVFVGLVGPEEIDPAVLEKERDNLHSSYHG